MQLMSNLPLKFISSFSTSFAPKTQANAAPLHTSKQFENVTLCRYSEYRNPHDDPDRAYKRGLTYWHILAARLAFLVLFENAVGLVQMFVAWAIPDVPRKLSDQIKREDYLTREIIIEQEKLLAQTAATGGRQSGQLHAALKNELFAGAAELTVEGNELLHRRASRKAKAQQASATAAGSVTPQSSAAATTTTASCSSSEEETEDVTQLTHVDEKTTSV